MPNYDGSITEFLNEEALRQFSALENLNNPREVLQYLIPFTTQVSTALTCSFM